MKPDLPGTKTVMSGDRINLSDVVRERQYSVILGDPGTGKTTLLRYLAYYFAKAMKDEQAQVVAGQDAENLGATLLPILLRIGDYVEQSRLEAGLSFAKYLAAFYYAQSLEFAAMLRQEMEAGRCLILLDGLDEVSDQATRLAVVLQIDTFVEAFPDNKFVVTSRIAGYREAPLGNRFAEFRVAPMTDAQVSLFLRRWCRVVEQVQQPEVSVEQCQRQGDAEAEELLAAIKQNEGVKRLTVNPLLLSIVALIHRSGATLPQRRVELYELAVETLINTWQLGRNSPYALHKSDRQRKGVGDRKLKDSEVRQLLEALAYWLHGTKSSGSATETEVVQQMAETLATLRGAALEAESVQRELTDLLKRIRETTGLVVERSLGSYSFMHLTFEEYFAALYMTNNDPDILVEMIRSLRQEPRWKEPILLALGTYGRNNSKGVSKLLERVFGDVVSYAPRLAERAVALRQAGLPKATLTCLGEAGETTGSLQLSALLLAGQVLAEVEVTRPLLQEWIKKLVTTGLVLDLGWDDETLQSIWQILRKIEGFVQQGDVMKWLEEVAEDTIAKDLRTKAQAARLYIASGRTPEILVPHAQELIDQLEPRLFLVVYEVIVELGETMTPSLEATCREEWLSPPVREAVQFWTALSYMRSPKKNYSTAIERWQGIRDQGAERLKPYATRALAICHAAQEAYKQAEHHYDACKEHFAEDQSFWRERSACQREQGNHKQAIAHAEQMATLANRQQCAPDEADALFHSGRAYQVRSNYAEAIYFYQQSLTCYEQLRQKKNVGNLWSWVADCYREWGKYEQAIVAAKQELEIRQQLEDSPNIADVYKTYGLIYAAWGKYAEAIEHHEQSRDLYEQLGRDKAVANQWKNLADCYREWGKYEQAIEQQQRAFELRQTLNDEALIAVSHAQFGWIYAAWGKYAEAIEHHEQSRDLYEQLGREKAVANQWKNLADCYREWGKYEQAIEQQQRAFELRQTLNDEALIAVSHAQFGWIYAAWGKYAEAIEHHEQSRDLYEQLGRDKAVANQWKNLADCYREWGKYEQAIEQQQRAFELRQTLNDEALIAVSHAQFGWIYAAWGKYAEAIEHHEQSRDLYEQLGRDKAVANQWKNLADCYREWGKYEQAIEQQQRAFELRQTLNDEALIAVSHAQFGWIYEAWGKYEQAIEHYQQSRDLYEQLGREKDVAYRWGWLSNCYRQWNKFNEALECGQKYLDSIQMSNNQSSIANAYYVVGNVYQSWGKYEQAIEQQQQSRDLYEQLGREKDVADQWANLADCYREWGKYEQAIVAAKQELEIRQQLEDSPNIADVYKTYGLIYAAWGKYAEAIEHHEQSRDLYEQLGRDKAVANQWKNLADCYREWDKYEQAIEQQQRAFELRQTLNDEALIAVSHAQFGWIYEAWGKYEQAIEHYQQSRDLYEQLGREKDVANQWKNLADCYREWGKYEQAIEQQQRAFELRQTLNDEALIAVSHAQFGWIYEAWGKYEQAIEHYQQSRDLYEQLGREKDVANQWKNLADCYREWGKYEQAIEQQQRAFELRQTLNDEALIAVSHAQFGWIYAAWGKYAEAIEHHEQSRDLYEQLGRDKAVANQWKNLADCYREIKQYSTAIEYYQKSCNLYRVADLAAGVARQLRQMSNTQRLWVHDTLNGAAVLDDLANAEHTLRQAIELDTVSDDKGNLAYDYTVLALLYAEHLHHLPADAATVFPLINQFEKTYQTGFRYLTELGQLIEQAEEALNIARAYIEVDALRDLGQAETLARQSLQMFQDYNRYKLAAAAWKLLGEIYQAYARHQTPDSRTQAAQYLNESLTIYRELDLMEKAAEVEQLMSIH